MENLIIKFTPILYRIDCFMGKKGVDYHDRIQKNPG